MSDTASMWAKMMGLGPILQAIQDPGFHAQIQGFVGAVLDVQQRVARIEAKLDWLIERQEATVAGLTPLFAEHGADGTGSGAATGGIADDGTRQLASPAGGAGNGADH